MITVHDPQLCEQLLGFKESPKPSSANSTEKIAGKKTASKPASMSSSISVGSMQRHCSQMIRAQEWLSRKSRRNVMVLPTDPEVQNIQELCDQLSKTEEHLIKELETFLDTQTSCDKCKREMLYKQWSERVFHPLQTAISKCVESTITHSDTERRRIFNHYLELRNTKDVFLDTIDVNEYDPMSLTTTAKTAKTGHFNDPLIAQHIDHMTELHVIKGCEEGIPHIIMTTANGREDTDPVTWLAMELVQIDSNSRQRSRKRMKGIRNHSHFKSQEDTESTTDLHISHKRLINYKRDRLSLEWPTEDIK